MNIHTFSFHLLLIILDRRLASKSGNTITPPVPVKPTTKAIPVRGAFKVVPKNIVAPKSIPKFGLRERPKFPKSPVIR